MPFSIQYIALEFIRFFPPTASCSLEIGSINIGTCVQWTESVHCTLYTLHSTLCTVQCTLYTVHTTHYTMHSTLYTLHSTQRKKQFAVYSLCFILFTLHYPLYCILYNVDCALYSIILYIGINIGTWGGKKLEAGLPPPHLVLL